MLKRSIIVAGTAVLSSTMWCSPVRTDAELSRLMVGAWRSPRHDYIYFADGTWWMGRPEPQVTRGTWRIEHGCLVETITFSGEQLAKPRVRPPMQI